MRILAVTNMYPTPRNPAFGTFVEQQIKSLREIGLDVDVLFVDRAGKGMCAYLGLRKQICARIRDSQPDLVHVMYGGVMAELVTRAVQDRPTVVSFCGSDLSGELWSGALRKIISLYGVLASRKASRRATAVVVKSKNLLDALLDDEVRAKAKIIPNGVNLEIFMPLNREACRKQLGWDPDHFHVLFPTTCGDPRKRPGLAQTAVKIVNNLGIKTDLHKLQGIAHSQVPVVLNASDVLLSTSFYEGSPNVLKEALACDVPVVSVDVGDVGERIQGIKGCHLALPTPEDLAAKLCLVHGSSRRVEGRASMEKLSHKNIALCLREFYSALLKLEEPGISIPSVEFSTEN